MKTEVSNPWKHSFTHGEYHIREYGNGDCVAHTKSHAQAERICADHNNAADYQASLTRLTAQRNKYREQVEVLTAIAKEALQFCEETHGLCDHDESMAKLCTQCEIREALAAVAEEGGGEE